MSYTIRAVQAGKVVTITRHDSGDTFRMVEKLRDSGWRIKVTSGDRVVLNDMQEARK